MRQAAKDKPIDYIRVIHQLSRIRSASVYCAPAEWEPRYRTQLTLAAGGSKGGPYLSPLNGVA